MENKNLFSAFFEKRRQKKFLKRLLQLDQEHRAKELERERPNALPIRENSDEEIGEKIFKVTVYGRNALEELIPKAEGEKVFSFREKLNQFVDLTGAYETESPFIIWSLFSNYESLTLEMYHSRGYAGRIVKVVRVFGLKNAQDIIDVLAKIEVNKKTKEVFTSFVK